MELSPGNNRMTVERGKEYLPQTIGIAMPATGELKRTVRLQRWIDMAKQRMVFGRHTRASSSGGHGSVNERGRPDASGYDFKVENESNRKSGSRSGAFPR